MDGDQYLEPAETREERFPPDALLRDMGLLYDEPYPHGGYHGLEMTFKVSKPSLELCIINSDLILRTRDLDHLGHES